MGPVTEGTPARCWGCSWLLIWGAVLFTSSEHEKCKHSRPLHPLNPPDRAEKCLGEELEIHLDSQRTPAPLALRYWGGTSALE